MQFRIVVTVKSAQEQGITLVTGLDVGELGYLVVDIPSDEYIKNQEKMSGHIYKFATDYIEKLIKLEITQME